MSTARTYAHRGQGTGGDGVPHFSKRAAARVDVRIEQAIARGWSLERIVAAYDDVTLDLATAIWERMQQRDYA